MKIIAPSFQILEELDNAPIAVRIEACGRICYKSEDKITEDSAVPFVSKIAAHGHNSVLEMAVVTFFVNCSSIIMDDFLQCQPKYLVIDDYKDGYLITGSIRSYRELFTIFPENRLINAVTSCLVAIVPYVFERLVESAKIFEKNEEIAIRQVPLPEVDTLPKSLKLRHRFVAVKFIVNRAVTHELVRHRPCSFLQESQRYCRYSEDKFEKQVTFIKPMFYREGSAEWQLWVDAMLKTEEIYLQLLETSSPQAARTVLPNSCKTEIIVFCNLVEWLHIFSLRTSTAAEPSMREIMVPLQDEMKSRYSLESSM
jgi:thymidylate synthase (FAD)